MRAKYKDEFIRIGLKISYYRKLKCMTQEELADKMGCDTSFIGHIEAPNMYKAISLETLFRVADALEIPAYKFLVPDDFTT